MQRFPIPTSAQLETTTGYTGGAKWSRKWKTLKNALTTYATKRTPAAIEAVAKAASAANKTFDAGKKREKVGEQTAVRVQASLNALLADCQIELLLRDYDRTERAGLVGHATRVAQLDRLQRIADLLLQTTDDQQVVAKFLAGRRPEPSEKADPEPTLEEQRPTAHEASDEELGSRDARRQRYVQIREQAEREQARAAERRLQAQQMEYREALVGRLKAAGYTPIQDAYWQAPEHDPDFVAPHVAWKAHLGATFGSAMELVEQVIPLFHKLGVDHKIDTNPEVFDKTNKFITIYPPGPTAAPWATIVNALEDAVGHLAVPVEGELRVGTSGVVGMRHGQISSLTVSMVERRGVVVKLGTPGPKGFEALSHVTLLAGEEPAPSIDVSASPGATLVARKQGEDLMLWFVGGTYGVCPAILHAGAIRPDPRKHPNPYGEPLPTGITPFAI